MSEIAFLRQVPVLSGLSDELLHQLAEEVGRVQVGAGEWVMREGETADSLYVIRSGRLEVIDEGPPESLIRVLRRGEVLGELALLREGVRSASVRARRDSELVELSRAQFEALVEQAPSFALGLTRSMGAQLAASRAPIFTATPPRTIAVLGLDAAAPAAEAGATLAQALATHGSVAELRPGEFEDEAAMITGLDRAEQDSDRAVLVGGAAAPGDPWTDFCLREAELVLAFSTGPVDPRWLANPAALRGCELVSVGNAVDQPTIRELAPREIQALADAQDLGVAMEVTARRLAGRAVGVVLSGGGARAVAHLGVLEELRNAGIVIDRIGAVSLGSVVGAGVASGYELDAIKQVFRDEFLAGNPTGDYTLPIFSLIRGRRTRDLLRNYFGQFEIEGLSTRFFCLSCDLIAREPVVHRTGPLFDAVAASLAIPGVFPPIRTPEGQLLVDGGVLDNLPVATMARTGEGPVIAIDVTGRIGGFQKPVRPGLARIGRPLRRFLTGSEAELPRLGETIVRTVTVGSVDTALAARQHADLLIQPAVEGIGLLDWGALERSLEAGRSAARAALEKAPDLF